MATWSETVKTPTRIPCAPILALVTEFVGDNPTGAWTMLAERMGYKDARSARSSIPRVLDGEFVDSGRQDFDEVGWVDRLLVALDAVYLWQFLGQESIESGQPAGLRCEDCGKGPLDPDDHRPLDLMRPDPSASRWVWNKTVGKPVYRPRNARPGGRRFRRVDLCRRCAGEALRKRAMHGSVSENGVKRALRTKERIPPKRGGRPRLLTDAELRQAHLIYARGEKSMLAIARALVESKGKGTVGGMNTALLYGWRRLELPVRSRSEVMTLIHRDVLGHQLGRRAAQTANKRRCSARRVVAGRHGGEPCTQYAVSGSEHCWNHLTFGTTPRAERRPRCGATTRIGRPCSLSPIDGSERCRLHTEGRDDARRMAARIRGTCRTQRPENLTTYTTVQPALRAYASWAKQQPRPADQWTGAPPKWRWLIEATNGRFSNTVLAGYANGDPDARMLKETAERILAGVDAVLAPQIQIAA